MVVDDERARTSGGADGVGLDAVRAQNVGELVHVGQRGREARVVGRDGGAGQDVVALVCDVAVVAEEEGGADCGDMLEWGCFHLRSRDGRVMFKKGEEETAIVGERSLLLFPGLVVRFRPGVSSTVQ